MAFSKANHYPKDVQDLCNFAKAIGHPARPLILLQLAVEGECCVENMTKNHPLCQSTMSDHISILREFLLVNYCEQYPFTFYSLNKKSLKRAEKNMKLFFKKLKKAMKQNRQKGRQH